MVLIPGGCPFYRGSKLGDFGGRNEKSLPIAEKASVSDRYGNRTRVTAVKGRCPNR